MPFIAAIDEPFCLADLPTEKPFFSKKIKASYNPFERKIWTAAHMSQGRGYA